MGLSLGASEGLVVGDLVNVVGPALTLGAPVGASDGCSVGASVGCTDGWFVGAVDGEWLGGSVGMEEGCSVGAEDGAKLVPCPVGLAVGV